MKYLLLLLLITQINSRLYAQWQEVEIPKRNINIVSTISINDTIFVLVGDNKVFREVNDNWERITVGENNERLLEMFEIDNKLFIRTARQVLYRSDNLGKSWTGYSLPLESGYDKFIYTGKYMYLYNYKAKRLWISNNQGESWIESPKPIDSAEENYFDAVDSFIVWKSRLTPWTSNTFFSNNSGKSWIGLNIDETDYAEYKFLSINNNELVLASNRYLYKSINDGRTWSRIIIDSNLIPLDIQELSNKSFYLIGNTILIGCWNNNKYYFIKSTDKGVTWLNNNYGLQGFPWSGLSIKIFNDDLYAIIQDSTSFQNILVKQSINDSIWNLVDCGSIVPEYIYGSDKGLFLYNNDSLYKSSYKGNTWENVTRNLDANYTTVSYANDTFLYLAGKSASYLSYDKGASWQELDNLKGLNIVEIEEIKGSFLIRTSDQELYYSNDLTNNKKLIDTATYFLTATKSMFITKSTKYTPNDALALLSFYDQTGNILDFKKQLKEANSINLNRNIFTLNDNTFLLKSDFAICISDTTINSILVPKNTIRIFAIDTILYSVSEIDNRKLLLSYKSIDSGQTWKLIDTTKIILEKYGSNYLYQRAKSYLEFPAFLFFSSGDAIYRYDKQKEQLVMVDTLPGWSSYAGMNLDDSYIYTNTFFFYKKPIQQWLLPILRINSDHNILCSNQIIELYVSKVSNSKEQSEFTIELSDRYGSFYKPVIIGKGKIQDSVIVMCKLPDNLPEGISYKVRATADKLISVENQNELIIPKSIKLSIRGSNKVTPNDEFVYSVQYLEGYKYEWFIESGKAYIVNKSKNVVSIKFAEEGFVKLKVEAESQEGCIVVYSYTIEVNSDTSSTNTSPVPFYITSNIVAGTDNLIINFYKDIENVLIELIDILGNLKASYSFIDTKEEIKIPANQLTTGIYFVRVKSKDKYYIEKVIVN